MESRKTVLINPSKEQQWRYKHREWICGHRVGKRGWDELRE